MENPIKIDDLGVPIFFETPFCFFLGNVFVVFQEENPSQEEKIKLNSCLVLQFFFMLSHH